MYITWIDVHYFKVYLHKREKAREGKLENKH